MALEERVQIGVERCRRSARTGQHPRRRAILDAEPLPAVGRHVAGLRRVGGEEGGVGQDLGEHRRQADQVLPVRAEAMEEHDELPGRAARPGWRRWAVQHAVVPACGGDTCAVAGGA